MSSPFTCPTCSSCLPCKPSEGFRGSARVCARRRLLATHLPRQEGSLSWDDPCKTPASPVLCSQPSAKPAAGAAAPTAVRFRPPALGVPEGAPVSGRGLAGAAARDRSATRDWLKPAKERQLETARTPTATCFSRGARGRSLGGAGVLSSFGSNASYRPVSSLPAPVGSRSP